MRTIAQAALAARGLEGAIKDGQMLWLEAALRDIANLRQSLCHDFVILGQNHVFDSVVSFDVVEDVLDLFWHISHRA